MVLILRGGFSWQVLGHSETDEQRLNLTGLSGACVPVGVRGFRLHGWCLPCFSRLSCEGELA